MIKKIFNLIIQPTHLCNLMCKYCYDKNNHPIREHKFINLVNLEKMFLMISKQHTTINCIWLGGEPLLFGIENFKKVLNLQKEITQNKGIEFHNSMETNATLLTSEICDFLKENNFTIGVSYDGEKNELTRNVSSEKMKKIFSMLKKRNMSFSCLYVLNSTNANSLLNDYTFFKDNNINFKINNCFSEDESDLVLDSKKYIDSMFDLFLTYYKDENKTIKINPFDEYMDMLTKQQARACHFGSCLGKFLCIDSYGDIYPCGRFHKKLCNIADVKNLDDIFNCETYKTLIIEKIKAREKCSNCELFFYCGSGCVYNTIIGSVFCEEFKSLFTKIRDYLQDSNSRC